MYTRQSFGLGRKEKLWIQSGFEKKINICVILLWLIYKRITDGFQKLCMPWFYRKKNDLLNCVCLYIMDFSSNNNLCCEGMFHFTVPLFYIQIMVYCININLLGMLLLLRNRNLNIWFQSVMHLICDLILSGNWSSATSVPRLWTQRDITRRCGFVCWGTDGDNGWWSRRLVPNHHGGTVLQNPRWRSVLVWKHQ